MKHIAQAKVARVALAAAAVAGILLTTFPAHALVVFDDGKMHTISDASYASERIEVRNGSKLKIVDGAVIAAPLPSTFDFTFAIQVFDRSMVIVQGGEFGADREDPDSLFSNWFSGAIAAFDQSKIIIQDGTFGKEAFRSGMIAILNDAHLNISGGTFTNPDGSGGRIEAQDNSEANISGGFFGSGIFPMHNSTLRISGGVFGKDNPNAGPVFYRGAIHANGASTVNISGGSFGVGTGFVIFSGAVIAQEAARVRISGGTFSGDPAFGNGLVLVQSQDAAALISGGTFNGTEVHVETGLATIKGCAFNLPFGPVDDLNATLQGILANGDIIDVTLTRDSADAIIDLIEDCNP